MNLVQFVVVRSPMLTVYVISVLFKKKYVKFALIRTKYVKINIFCKVKSSRSYHFANLFSFNVLNKLPLISKRMHF